LKSKEIVRLHSTPRSPLHKCFDYLFIHCLMVYSQTNNIEDRHLCVDNILYLVFILNKSFVKQKTP